MHADLGIFTYLHLAPDRPLTQAIQALVLSLKPPIGWAGDAGFGGWGGMPGSLAGRLAVWVLVWCSAARW